MRPFKKFSLCFNIRKSLTKPILGHVPVIVIALNLFTLSCTEKVLLNSDEEFNHASDNSDFDNEVESPPASEPQLPRDGLDVPFELVRFEPEVATDLNSTKVTILGKGFGNSADRVKVYFGDQEDSGNLATILAVHDSTIECQAPKNLLPGSKIVTVLIDQTAQSFQRLFSFRRSGLYYVDTDGISPNYGPTTGGDEVRIKGFNLSSDLTVDFGLQRATCTLKSFTEMVCSVPPSSPGVVDITVSNKLDPQLPTYRVSKGYTYYNGPTITSISNLLSNSKKGQYTVTVKGSNFKVEDALAEVRIAGSKMSRCAMKQRKIICSKVTGTPGEKFSVVVKVDRLGKVKEESTWALEPPPTDDPKEPVDDSDTHPEDPVVDLIERPATTITYQTIFTQTDTDQNSVDLYPWLGRNIALLTPTAQDLDQVAMSRLINAYDRAYDYYKETLGFEPTSYARGNYSDRTTIAVVHNTCGAGCGWVGFDGIEIMNSIFTSSYESMLSLREIGQPVFYELGRNFYKISDKIGYIEDSSKGEADPVGTGFAIYMRFKSMEAIGVQGASFKGVDFEEFREEVEALVDSYESDPSWTWENSLNIGKAPKDRKSLGLGATDLWASFLLRIEQEFTDQPLQADFAKNFFAEIAQRNGAKTTQDAVDNFILSACAASQRNLIDQFVNVWHWPLSAPAQQEIESRFP